MNLRALVALVLLVLVVGLVSVLPASQPPTTTAAALPAPVSATFPSKTTVTVTTTVEPRWLRLAPSWELVGEGDRIGALMFGTGEELIVWGGTELPTSADEPPELFNGVAWSHNFQTSRSLAEPPFGTCSGDSEAVWTGTELVAWFRPFADPTCGEGVVAAYTPSTDSWRLIDAPEFLAAGSQAVWSGTEILAWRQGLALDPSTGEVRHFEPLEIGDGSLSSRVHAHWTGEELLVMGDTMLHRYDVDADTWTRLDSPPIETIAQASAWTGEKLLAVNYLMEAALFDPISETWTRIESMPLRFWETLPVPASSTGLAIVRMGSSMAALDGESWVAMSDPVMEWAGELPYGGMAIADGWIYQVGNFVLRRPIPSVVGDGVQTEAAIPLQTLLLAMPIGWTAQLIPEGSSEHHSYALADEAGRTCQIEAWHHQQPPTLVEAIVISTWTDAEMTIGVDPAQSLAVVDDFARSSDWVEIRCDSPEAAQFLASHVWVAP